MNIAIPYPFYMDSSRHPFSVPWCSNPYRLPMPVQPHYPPVYQHPPSRSSQPYPPAFALSQQRSNLPPRILHPATPYSNMRYNHLKQSTNHVNRHRSMDAPSHAQHYSVPCHHEHRPSKTKSVSDFQQTLNPTLNALPKAHSWHCISPGHQPNPLERLHIHPHDHHYHNHSHHHSHPQPSARQPQTKPRPPRDNLVRVSTSDSMPTMTNPVYQRRARSNSKRNPPTISRQPYSSCSSSSSGSSGSGSESDVQSLFQKRFNGSLATDPSILAAMEDFRELRRTSSQSMSLTPHRRIISRDSLCSESTHHSSSTSHIRSQSSFTSLERLEIRHLIKALKAPGVSSYSIPFPPSVPPAVADLSRGKPSPPLPIIKQQLCSITEELDREFSQLRSIDPNRDLIYVKPSLIRKQKTGIPPLPTLDQLFQRVKHQAEASTSETQESAYENPASPVSTHQSIPSLEITPATPQDALLAKKPEYATPMRGLLQPKPRPAPKKDEQLRSFSFCKPMDDIVHDKRPLSMLNYLQYGLTNPLPSTLRATNDDNNCHEKSLVKENIYASDVDVQHLPLFDAKDYLNDETMMTDYFSQYKPSRKNSSVFKDVSRLFSRFGAHRKHDDKSPLKSNLQKNNPLRCSIM